MKDDSFSHPSRRRVLQGVAAFGALGAPAVLRFARAQSKRIVVRDDGGIYTKAYGAVYYRPFTEKTGIEVVGVQANAEPVAQIKSMVDTKSYTWDMAKISQPAILLLTTQGKVYLEKHGLENDPAVKTIPAHYMSPFGVPTNIYSTVLAYRTDAFKGRKAPNSWSDFWNVKDFPGRRSLRKHPFDTLEESAMASGVPTSQLYPLNLDKAFANLDAIKPKVEVWWNSGAQVEQMLKSGEVDMIATWVSRPQSAMADGAPVAIVWNQNLWGVDNWSILAGTPNADACREFMKFASDPKRMASLVEYFPAGVTQPDAFKYIKADIAKNCPTHPDNIKNGVQINAKYWLDNQAAVTEKFNAWILSLDHAMAQPKLAIAGLTKRYGSFTALAPTDLEVAEGEFLTLLGPSGSGKTTLLSLIAGLSVPDGGQLRINGKDATYAAAHERDIGMVFQNYALFPHMTIAENIAFPLKMRRVDNASAARRAMEALELVRLPQVASRYPKELSGGQQQRIALARCLVYKPSIVLMDEPLGALDKKLRDHMQLEIKRIHRDTGATIVYVTHDQEEAMTMSDRICLMNGGTIEQLGTPSDLYFQPKTLFVADFIGESNLLRGSVSAANGANVEVTLGDGATRVTATAHTPMSSGDKVRVMVRPQNIAPAGNGSNALRGRIVDSMITGSLTKLYLESAFSAEEPIVLSYPTSAATRPHAVGSELAFSWHAGDAVAVPEVA